VSELEAENRALRSGETPPPTRAKSTDREASPAQSVISLANDLGIPPEIVSSSGGVNLANVAPPPADLEPEVKPVIASPSPTPIPLVVAPMGNATLASLQIENATLRERVGLLENLVKQVVALANLSGLPSSASALVSSTQSAPSVTVDEQAPLDWDTLVNSTTQNNNLNATLSPSMYPVEPLESTRIDINLAPSLPSVSAFPSNNSEMNLACHPAVMATCAGNPGQALQRARTTSPLGPLEMSSDRLGVMAKVIIELARVRGMSSHSPLTWTTRSAKPRSDLRARRARLTRRESRSARIRSRGMRG
jgi:hypothetical protein